MQLFGFLWFLYIVYSLQRSAPIKESWKWETGESCMVMDLVLMNCTTTLMPFSLGVAFWIQASSSSEQASRICLILSRSSLERVGSSSPVSLFRRTALTPCGSLSKTCRKREVNKKVAESSHWWTFMWDNWMLHEHNCWHGHLCWGL